MGKHAALVPVSSCKPGFTTSSSSVSLRRLVRSKLATPSARAPTKVPKFPRFNTMYVVFDFITYLNMADLK